MGSGVSVTVSSIERKTPAGQPPTISFLSDHERALDELHGDHVSAKHGSLELRRHVEKWRWSRRVSRDDQARKIPRK